MDVSMRNVVQDRYAIAILCRWCGHWNPLIRVWLRLRHARLLV